MDDMPRDWYIVALEGLKAENRGLVAEIGKLREDANCWCTAESVARDEVERLRAALEEIADQGEYISCGLAVKALDGGDDD